MAGYTCDVCNTEQAILLMTNLQLGDTQAVGVECLPMWSVGFAEQFVGPIKPADVDAPVDLVPTDKPVTAGRRKGKAPETATEPEPADTAATEPPTGE